MKTIKTLINETKSTFEMKGLMEVYEELAAIKMQKIRQSILAAREFFDSISRISVEIGTDFEDIKDTDRKQTAAVFVSANTGLYGQIIYETFSLFIDFVKKNDVDVFIIGNVGEQLLKEYKLDLSYRVFQLSDDTVDDSSLTYIIQQVLSYKKVLFFYGRFKNIVIQTPSIAQISGDLLPKSNEGIEILKKKQLQFLYEPSVFDVTNIFGNEILSSTIEQLLRESQLAKLGSRLINLDDTIEHINDHLGQLGKQRWRMQKQTMDKKQNALISGIIARGEI